MLNFQPTVTFDSKSCPGAKITVKRLSAVKRAERDMEIAETNLRIAEIQAQLDALREPYATDKSKDGRPVKWAGMSIKERVEDVRLEMESGALYNRFTKPTYIRYGFVSVEGMQHDGQPITAESLIELGPDSLLDEVYLAVAIHSALTFDQIKNSQSPTTSIEAGTVGENSSTANGASEPESIVTATAASTSQGT
jgi:hypothetical protein